MNNDEFTGMIFSLFMLALVVLQVALLGVGAYWILKIIYNIIVLLIN